MQWDKLSAFIEDMCERDVKGGESGEDWPGIYFRVRAGDRVRTAGTIASQLDIEGRAPQVMLDKLRGIVWRNTGHRVYVVEGVKHGEKSPLDSVRMHGEPEQEDEQVTDGGAVAALSRALVKTAGQADERAMFVAARNAEMADKMLDMARELAAARAELRMLDVIGDMQTGDSYGQALNTFLQTAGPTLAKLLADRMPAPQPQKPQPTGDPWTVAEGLLVQFEQHLAAHPALLGSGGVPSVQALALLTRFETACRSNMTTLPESQGAEAGEPQPVVDV
jgi:dsDNA-binding SOS-regulon protein